VASSKHPNHRAQRSLPPELRRLTVPAGALSWVERQCRIRVVGVRRLPGASTSAVHRLVMENGSNVVLRRYVWPFILAGNPVAPQREADALVFGAAAGLPAPALTAEDITGAEGGDGVPAVLMAFVPGRPVAVPDLERSAGPAGLINAADPAGFDHRYADWFAGGWERSPANAASPWLWERAAEVVAAGPPEWRPVFIHRDLHSGNVLWRRGRWSGVVDWVVACVGPAGCDVAHCRANLERLADHDAAERFRRAYETETGATFHPYWDLADPFEHGPAPWSDAEVAAGEARLARALVELGHHPASSTAARLRPLGRRSSPTSTPWPPPAGSGTARMTANRLAR